MYNFTYIIYVEGDASSKRCCYNFVKQLSPLDTTLYQVLKISEVESSAVACVENCRKNQGCMKISFKHSNKVCVLFTMKTSQAEMPIEYIEGVEIYQRA